MYEYKKYIIIGDVHGCHEELSELVEPFLKEDRQIVFVGDLIDKGPDSGRVVEFARKYSATVVLGNHEEKHLRFHQKEITGAKNEMAPKKHPDKFQDFISCREQLLSLPFDAFDFLKSFQYCHYISDSFTKLVVIHGGLEKNKRPEDIHYKKLCRIRNLTPDGKMVSLNEIKETTLFWTKLFDPYKTFGEFRKVVFGHAPTMEPIQGYAVGIDTGCAYGNKLTAYLAPEDITISVPAKKAYSEQEHTNWLKL